MFNAWAWRKPSCMTRKVVILDEPMSGLDPVGRRECANIILELKQAGKTVLFSTHICRTRKCCATAWRLIVGGKLRGVGAPDEIVRMKAQAMEVFFSNTMAPKQDCQCLLKKSTANGKGAIVCSYRKKSCTRRSTLGMAEQRFFGDAGKGHVGRITSCT